MDSESIRPLEEQAERNLQDAVTNAQTGAIVIRNWDTVLSELRGMYEENGFGRDLKKIMMMSVRES